MRMLLIVFVLMLLHPWTYAVPLFSVIAYQSYKYYTEDQESLEGTEEQ